MRCTEMTVSMPLTDRDAFTAGAENREDDADQPQAVSLRAGELWAAGMNPGGLRLRCVSGAVWVTQASETGDVVLRPGDEWVAGKGGKLVVQALADACFRIETRSLRSAPSGLLSRRWGRVLRALPAVLKLSA